LPKPAPRRPSGSLVSFWKKIDAARAAFGPLLFIQARSAHELDIPPRARKDGGEHAADFRHSGSQAIPVRFQLKSSVVVIQ